MAQNGNEASTTGAGPDPSSSTPMPDRTRLRAWVAAVLVVLTSLSLAIATVSVWTHQTLFDTDQFMEVVDDAIDDPALAAAISEEVSDQVLVALDLRTRIGEALDQLDATLSAALISLAPGDRIGEILGGSDRPTLSVLAPSIAQTLEERIEGRIDEFISSEQFRVRLEQIVRRSHEAAVALIRSDIEQYENVYVQDDEVRLNLLGIIASALQEIRADIDPYLPDVTLPDVVSGTIENATAELADALEQQLPDDFGQVTIMSADTLGDIQSIGDTADRFVVLIVVLTVVLLIVAIAVSPDRRRTLIHLAIGAVAAIVLALVAIRGTRTAIVNQITDPNGEQLADSLLIDLIDDLRSFAVVVVVVAVLVGLGAFIAGRPALMARFTGRREATDLTDTDRWVAAHAGLVRGGALVVAVGALAFLGVAWWSVLIGALVLAGLLLYVNSVTTEVSDAGDRQAQDAHP